MPLDNTNCPMWALGMIGYPVLCLAFCPLFCCTDLNEQKVEALSIGPELANGIPMCLFCPLATIYFRQEYCAYYCQCMGCTRLNEHDLVNGFVASGDTCFVKCYHDPSLMVTANSPENAGGDFQMPKSVTTNGSKYKIMDLNNPGTNKAGNRPLHFAVSELYDYNTINPYCFQCFPSLKRKTVDYLLANGADSSLTNKKGQTPFDVLICRYVSDEAYEKLQKGHEKAQQRKLEQEKQQAEDAKNAILTKQLEEEKLKLEAQEGRYNRIASYQTEIQELEDFFMEICSFPLAKSKFYAEHLVLDYDCTSFERFQTLFTKGLLEKPAFQVLKISEEEKEKLKKGFAIRSNIAAGSSSGRAKKNQIVPINNNEPQTASVALTDCFLTHDWGMDEKERSNHERVAKINKFLQSKGLITWFDEDRMEGNVRRKMTEGIDNTLSMIVFITDRYRNKVNGTEERDNCRYEFTYGVEQQGPQRMIPVVMESRMLNAREWKQELGAALATKLYVNMISDEEEEFQARCEELYQRIKSVIGQCRRERGEA